MTLSSDRLLVQSAPRLARLMLVMVLCGLGLASIECTLFSAAGPLGLIVGVAVAIAIVAVQLYVTDKIDAVSSFPPSVLRIVRPLILTAQAVLVHLPLVVTDLGRPVLPGLLAGSALLLLPSLYGVPVFLAVVIEVGLVDPLAMGSSWEWPHLVLTPAITAVCGLVVYGLTGLRRSILDHQRARVERERSIAAEERVRFSRDVHDLLGLSLLAISVKAELTAKLLVEDPGRAGVELSEVLLLARQGLADVRSVATGVRTLSLEDELRNTRRTLRDLGLAVQVRHSRLQVADDVASVLAAALREGATNVLRHSNASNCEIVLDLENGGVLLRLVNDGADHALGSDLAAGQGICNIADRAAALGGTVHTATVAETHTLEVHIPLTTPQPPS